MHVSSLLFKFTLRPSAIEEVRVIFESSNTGHPISVTYPYHRYLLLVARCSPSRRRRVSPAADVRLKNLTGLVSFMGL